MDFDLKGQIALVTGASRGIGQATALALGRAGAYVIGTATSEAGAQGITEAFAEARLEGEGEVLDVCNGEQIEALVKKLTQGKGPPTILVNNAGVTGDDLVLRMKDEAWQRILDTNLTGAYRLSKAVLRGMLKARAGRIINIGSVVGSTGNPGQANYAAAKAGLLGFTKSLAREIGSRGVTVNAVAPGFIETDMTAEFEAQTREAIVAQTALGRLGKPEDIAAAVVFLASDVAAYITGETLHVNGGMYMA